jgi:XTP/dITP diphosphohydrolase
MTIPPCKAAVKPLIITLATKNEGKRQELMHWLENSGLPVTLALNPSAQDVEETGSSFLENAWLKAEQTPPVLPGGYVLAEDSGLVVDALDGRYQLSPFPGLHSNRWLTPAIRDELLGLSHPNRIPLDRTTAAGITNSDLCQGILALLQGESNRKARYCCGMVLWHPERGRCFESLEHTELWVIDGEPRGHNGFGYDPITLPVDAQDKPSPRTMAELSTQEKNALSHRGRAFQKVLAYVDQHGEF